MDKKDSTFFPNRTNKRSILGKSEISKFMESFHNYSSALSKGNNNTKIEMSLNRIIDNQSLYSSLAS